MRQMCLALVLAGVSGFAVASCGSSSHNGDMGPDLGGSADMVQPKLSCEGVGSCVYNCLLTGQAQDLATCARTICAPMAKVGSEPKWEAAVLCGEGYCTGGADMGTAKCIDQKFTTDMGSGDALCDPNVTVAQCLDPAYVSMICSPCLANARNYWFFDETVPNNPAPPTFMCPDPASADCTGAATKCAQEFTACKNDM